MEKTNSELINQNSYEGNYCETVLRLLEKRKNKKCADCGTENPEYASVAFGVFVCQQCSEIHKSLDLKFNVVKSINKEWNKLSADLMIHGGNRRFSKFMRSYDIPSESDISFKYRTVAANYYREYILAAAQGKRFSAFRPSIETGLLRSNLDLDSSQEASLVEQKTNLNNSESKATGIISIVGEELKIGKEILHNSYETGKEKIYHSYEVGKEAFEHSKEKIIRGYEASKESFSTNASSAKEIIVHTIEQSRKNVENSYAKGKELISNKANELKDTFADKVREGKEKMKDSFSKSYEAIENQAHKGIEYSSKGASYIKDGATKTLGAIVTKVNDKYHFTQCLNNRKEDSAGLIDIEKLANLYKDSESSIGIEDPYIYSEDLGFNSEKNIENLRVDEEGYKCKEECNKRKEEKNKDL